MNDLSVTTILILAANPQNSTPLRLDEEVRGIDEGLRMAKYRERFSLEQRWAVRPKDLQKAILDFNPQIVHFSGHGMGGGGLQDERASSIGEERKLVVESEGEGGLALEDDQGQMQLVATEALASLFALFADQVRCVLLNACYSDVQAVAIAQHIPFVIGMNKAVGDVAARVFALAFYDALGAGQDIEFAFQSGCVALQLEGIPEALTPVLRKRSNMPEALTPGLIQCSDLAKVSSESADKHSSTDIVLEIPEGVVSNKSTFCIHSIHENNWCQELQKPGSLILIKSPARMGKSSLLISILNESQPLGYRFATLDLAQTNQKFFQDPDKFMQWFCASVGKPLEVRVKVEEYWDDMFGGNDNATDYFNKYLLDGASQPLVVAIDNFDRVFEYPDIETDFCGLLRGWHERSKVDARWNSLRLVLAYSEESRNPRPDSQSPFNVGLKIALEEFTVDQIKDLVSRHGLNWTEQDLVQLTDLVGGHPYLVRGALYNIARGQLTLAEFLRTAPTEAGIYSSHLREHMSILEQSPELLAAMKNVVMSEKPIRLETKENYRLCSMGLLVRIQNDVQPRCLLYRKYFLDRLGT